MKVKLRDITIEQKNILCKKYNGVCPNCSLGFSAECLYNIEDFFGPIIKDSVLNRMIYVPEPTILDDKEKEFLQKFINLFPAKIIEIEKYIDSGTKEEFLMLFYTKNNKNDGIHFPRFKMGSMYKGMEKLKPYKIEELGLKPKEK